MEEGLFKTNLFHSYIFRKSIYLIYLFLFLFKTYFWAIYPQIRCFYVKNTIKIAKKMTKPVVSDSSAPVHRLYWSMYLLYANFTLRTTKSKYQNPKFFIFLVEFAQNNRILHRILSFVYIDQYNLCTFCWRFIRLKLLNLLCRFTQFERSNFTGGSDA